MSPISMTARLLTHICCYLYPAYRGYKITESVQTDETYQASLALVTYWAVLGVWLTVESVIGWTFTWIPFYYVFRFLVLFYISLPQTEAASYIFQNYLGPLFREHEADIDSFISSLRGRTMSALTSGLAWLWEKARTQLAGALPTEGQGAAAEGYDLHQQHPFSVTQPPTLQDPASGPAKQLFGFVSKYAGQYTPVVIAAISSAANAARSSQQARSGPINETEVASTVPETMSMPIPRPNTESDTSLRSRTFLHAREYPTTPTPSNGVSSARSSRNFSGSAGNLSQRSSQESVQTRNSSRRESGVELSSYDQIHRDEVGDIPDSDGSRPQIGKRGSSWFGSWGTPEKPKAE